ncbi:glyoxalase [Enterococcus thailandicus]|uniref:VOC family protein n=1 Tax=Enterococcus TaxID=1350 RepID=UPI00244D8454|nr:VOC family protein [Enterococcus thailandicus]MDK4352931.1 VOC family protein [Enterococcus thailandicus]MDT2734027.1 VOC family protein [Enterococcus thailandicus]MEA4829393.1 VOC family protein [Enterococcus thailandicus]GMC03353.1 glyoxalase [Enterococcus thailandicus]GMC09469.1 glyoxalase [Enterococcus thailandicus]
MAILIPDFQLTATAHIGVVALNVSNLVKMTDFYERVIGLTLLESTENQSVLGVKDQALLILIKIENPLPVTRKTGLYHVAFLLPTREALGDALLHYLQIEAPIAGASDHGYSEALYLTDPEGNGIEVYRDKPMSEWMIKEDGEIVGVTEELDGDGVLEAASRHWQGFPKGTIVGHVHLKVSDLDQTQTFFTEVLGLSLKNDFGNQAKFFAAGSYHHHIGSNIWLGTHIPAMEPNDLGLNYYTFEVPLAELTRLEKHWKTKTIDYEKNEEGQLILFDPNGIQVRITGRNPQIDA